MLKYVIPASLLILSVLVVYFLMPAKNQQFDRALWQDLHFNEQSNTKNIDQERSLRYLMVDDLISNKLIKGVTSRDQVRKLLGNPDATEVKPGPIKVDNNFDAFIIRYHYNMIDFDTKYLVIEYDASATLKATRQINIQG